MKSTLRAALAAACFAAAVNCAAEPGIVTKSEPLRAEPYSDAKPLASLAKDAKVEVLRRQGAWSLVRAGDKEGWMRSLNLRTASTQAGDAPSAQASKLLALESGRSGSGNAIATLGIRGPEAQGAAGEPIALQAFAKVIAGADPARVVTLDPSRTTFAHAADALELSLHAKQAGHLYVLRAAPAGDAVELVFPNRADTANTIQAGQRFTLPRSGWSLAAGGPGRNFYLAIVSARAVQFDASAGQGSFDKLRLAGDNPSALQQHFAAASYGASYVAIDAGN